MRKLAVFVVLFVIASFFSPQDAMAECLNVTERCFGGVPIRCNATLCCTTPDECPGGTTANEQASQQSSICDAMGDKQGECNSCMQDGNGVWTAIGCIETTSPTQLFGGLFGIGIGIAGGIAFLLILFGGLQILTSAGNPEQLNAGRELVSAAVIGLILVIFSIFLLKFIGVNIIGIPGFGTPGTFNPAR